MDKKRTIWLVINDEGVIVDTQDSEKQAWAKARSLGPSFIVDKMPADEYEEFESVVI